MRSSVVDVSINDISAGDDEGTFLVTSLSHDAAYTVACHGDHAPSCTCRDWRRHHLPCKHMLAVFMYKPEYGWESLSSAYTRLPFFRLDTEVVGSAAVVDVLEESSSNGQCQKEDVDDTHDDDARITESMPADNSDGVEPADSTDNQSNLPHVQVLQSRARQLCSTVTSLTYSLNDTELLQQGIATLQDLSNAWKGHTLAHNRQHANSQRRRFGKRCAARSALQRRLNRVRAKKAIRRRRRCKTGNVLT